MWQSGFLLLLAATTSVLAGLLTRAPRVNGPSLGGAVLLVLEMAGLGVLFLLGNLVLGLAIVLTIRSVSPAFVSVYVLNDGSLLALSAVQGAVFVCWRRGRLG